MKVSCAFPTTMSSPEDIRIAEEIGYERAWLYDTPQQSPDVWMSLALAAERTSRIGLGPGVLIPSLRHPMTNAAATATLAGLAPGRVAVSFGTGFTGRRAMGYRAIPWSYMTAYIDAYCGLLRGEVVEWEGARMQMLHPDGSAPARPVDVPILIGALGPKGRDVAARHDGVFATTTLEGLEPGAFDWVAYLYWGTVLEPGEDVSSERVLAAAGPGGALAYHATYELYGRDAVPDIPGGKEWLAVIDERPGGRTPPRRARRPLHPPQRGRPGGVGGDRRGAAAVDDGHRHRRRSQSPHRRPRRQGRHRGGLPAVRTRHPPRAGGDVRRRQRLMAPERDVEVAVEIEPPRDLPTGTVTFLFTDVEGSTERWQRDESAMSTALAAHDQVIRAAVEACDGRVFKHTGDGMCAVFTSARQAVSAAVQAQRLLTLPVRMGVHTGEAELRDGDYYGPTLNRTARVMDAGHGGQILLSAATAELADEARDDRSR